MNHHIKQVIVVRKDLNMRKGKMCAQASHASLGSFLSSPQTHIDKTKDSSAMMIAPLSADAARWFETLSTKIVLGTDSEKNLLDLYQKALDLNLPCYLVKDAGLTEFGGVATYTAVGIGPADAKTIDLVTALLVPL